MLGRGMTVAFARKDEICIFKGEPTQHKFTENIALAVFSPCAKCRMHTLSIQANIVSYRAQGFCRRTGHRRTYITPLEPNQNEQGMKHLQ